MQSIHDGGMLTREKRTFCHMDIEFLLVSCFKNICRMLTLLVSSRVNFPKPTIYRLRWVAINTHSGQTMNKYCSSDKSTTYVSPTSMVRLYYEFHDYERQMTSETAYWIPMSPLPCQIMISFVWQMSISFIY